MFFFCPQIKFNMVKWYITTLYTIVLRMNSLNMKHIACWNFYLVLMTKCIFQLHSWTSPIREHTVNHVHAEAVLSNRMSVDENIPGQVIPVCGDNFILIPFILVFFHFPLYSKLNNLLTCLIVYVVQWHHPHTSYSYIWIEHE